MQYKFFIISVVFLLISCRNEKQDLLYSSEELLIKKVSKNSYNHISFLNTESFGKVKCNGAIFTDHGKALIIDCPPTVEAATELIHCIETDLKYTVEGIVVSHFHVDCLGSLEVFHEKNIPSYATTETIRLAKLNNYSIPQNEFKEELEIKLGKQRVENAFLGEGHTIDNIVSYWPSDKVLFGGCLIKSIGAGKGNLKDANVNTWSNTVQKVKEQYPNAQKIIPGHGDFGGRELLDYTIEKFK